ELNLENALEIINLDIYSNINLEKLNISGTKIKNIDISRIDEQLSEFIFNADLSSEENFLECIKVSSSFLNKFRQNTTKYPDSWNNLDGDWESLYPRGNGDVARYMCYEEYINFNDEYNGNGQIMFDDNGDLYLSASSPSGGGILYRFTSQNDKSIVAGGNGDGTDLNQLRRDFKFDFDSENNLIIMDGRFYNQQFDEPPIRVLKWVIGQSNANLITNIEQNNQGTQGSYPVESLSPNIMVDEDDNIYFSSSRNIYSIESGTTDFTKIVKHEDFIQSDYQMIGGRGYKWFSGGVDMFENKIFEMTLYHQYSHLLSFDKSNSYSIGQYTYHSKQGVNSGGDEIQLIKGTDNYFLARGYYNTYIANKLDSSGNGWIKLNGHNLQLSGDSTTKLTNKHYEKGHESIAIKNGYVYILTWNKILKSTSPLE
ncbi:hypothetical protein N9I99_01450, partial [Flavobacteriaceae bacterium]|nr:hypothetical protein [Flavobacteriaceae bacterium]